MSELRWNPFAALQQQRTQDHEDTEAQELLADAITADPDQGQPIEPPPAPPNMNDRIRAAAVGIRTPRDRRGNRVPETEIGD